MKNRDIIITGLQPWDIEIGSNCKNIAHELSKHNRVLYVNTPLDRLTQIKQRNTDFVKRRKKVLKGEDRDLIQIQDNIWTLNPKTILESINQLNNNTLFDYLNKINNKRFAKQISIAIQELDFHDYILFTDSDIFRSFYLKELLKPQSYVYYTRDNLVAVDYWKKQGVRLEAKHMAKADLVVANSVYLASHARKFNPNSFFVGQGCDVAAYDRDKVKEIPKELINMESPIIGYIGALYSLRLDIDVIELIARSKPEWNIVLIGPQDESFSSSILHSIPNIHFLGNKNPEELPAYLAAFDVAINPQILNSVTIGNYPRKIDEYLAMGVPTVATKTEAMSYFSGHVYLPENADGYVKMISKAMIEDSEKKRKERSAFAKTHTWENNVINITEAITKVGNNSKA